MAFAAYDIIGILERELRDLEVPASCVAKLAGVSTGRMSAYFNGVNCPAQHQLQLREAWSQLKKLIAFAAPLPLGFSKHKELMRCIKMMSDGELQVVVVTNSGDPGEKRPHV